MSGSSGSGGSDGGASLIYPSGLNTSSGGSNPTTAGEPAPLPADYTWFEAYSLYPSQHLSFLARFGEGAVKPSGGGAGWQSVPRPKKQPLTSRRGPQEAFHFEIPLIFDGWPYNSVEGDCRTLDIMAGVNVDGDPDPPLLLLNAHGALPYDVFHNPNYRWVIPEAPDYGEALRYFGKRVRQIVTVKFMLWTQDDQLNRAHQIASANQMVTARAGDTYNSLAARYLNKYGGIRWGNRLAQLNGARDGASHTLAGQQIKLPTAQQIADWKRQPRR